MGGGSAIGGGSGGAVIHSAIGLDRPQSKYCVEEMKGKNFALVAINRNNPDALSINELG